MTIDDTFCQMRNCTRYMLCPENIPVVQARDCGAHELDDGRPQHGGTVRSRHAHIVAKDNSTVPCKCLCFNCNKVNTKH
jgi:hypothetical protein